MLLKILGSIVIILCAAKIGFDEAARYTRRVREIRELQSALIALKGEISFCRTPLSSALIKTGQRLKTSINQIFVRAGEALRDGGKSAGEAWEAALFNVEKELSLKNEELYILSTFGKLLGISDAGGQIENIELAREKLAVCEKQALEDEAKFARLYRSLGIIGGVFTAILFI